MYVEESSSRSVVSFPESFLESEVLEIDFVLKTEGLYKCVPHVPDTERIDKRDICSLHPQ